MATRGCGGGIEIRKRNAKGGCAGIEEREKRKKP